MLGSELHVVAVAEILERASLPLVVDPVMVASTGDALITPEAIGAYRDRLLPLASLTTPNHSEAAALLGRAESDELEAQELARSLAEQVGGAVLLTGGDVRDGTSPDVTDWFYRPGSKQVCPYTRTRIETANRHGTGCTLASGVAAGLAHGEDLETAIAGAISFVTRALQESYSWADGPGALNQLALVPFRSS